MIEFFQALANPAVPFLLYAVLAGALAAPAFGIIGSYVVVNRISYLAGAISHSVLAGIGLSLLLRHRFGITVLTPFWGAFIAAIISALIVAWASRKKTDRTDSVISIVWSLGAAIGVIFLAWTPGFVDPMAYLFGNILLLSPQDLIGMLILDGVILGTALLFYPQFMAMSFDDEFAQVRGMPTDFHRTLLLVLTGATVVLLVSTVGIVLVITLLTLPAAAAGFFSRTLRSLMIGASLIALGVTFFGIALSYVFDLPSGAGIVLCAIGVYSLARAVHGIGVKLNLRSFA